MMERVWVILKKLHEIATEYNPQSDRWCQQGEIQEGSFENKIDTLRPIESTYRDTHPESLQRDLNRHST